MTQAPTEVERANFAAVVLLLRQMAHQLVQGGQVDQARGLVDGIVGIRALTRGNVNADETKFLDDVIYELQMHLVKGPGNGEEGADPASPSPEEDGG